MARKLKETTAKKRKKPHIIWRIIGGFFATIAKILLSIFLICMITGCIVATAMAVYVLDFYREDPLISLDDYKMNYTSIMYAENENGTTYELMRFYESENRIWVDLEDIPEHMRDAFVAVEDYTFYDHSGVNWKRTFAAFLNEILPIFSDRQGGSTITQQVIKNITGDDEISPKRKIQEIIRAIKIERVYSKDDILECYLNTLHLGSGTNGVQTAANLYFDKDVSQLTMAESATIAAVTSSPSYYNPKTNYDNCMKQQKYVLSCMLEYGFITEAEHKAALAEKIVIADKTITKQINSYFEDMVFEDVVRDLMAEYGYTKTKAVNMMYNGGLRIYATLNETIQHKLEEMYMDEELLEYINPTKAEKEAGEEHQQLESATIVMDFHGRIVGVVGGRGEKNGDRELNRATDSLRQPGSTMKPIAVYSLAIEYNLVTWSSVIEDSPAMQLSGKDYPVNYYGRYDGPMTVEEALCRSVNTVAVKVVQMVSPSKSFEFLTRKLGITSLVGTGSNNDVDVGPMALGGVTYGISPREMAGAYQVFGNGGMYNKPISYTKVTDYQGNTLLENPIEPTRVLSEATATVMNKLLQRNVTSGTGAGITFDGWQLAGKTGTTNDDKDYWWIGMSPEYVAATWVGFDIPESYIYYSGGHPAIRIWKRCMRSVHEGLEQTKFLEYGEVVSKTYCKSSGGLANEYCPETGSGWYKANNVPSTCIEHYAGWTPEGEFDLSDFFGDNPFDFVPPISGGSESASSQSQSSESASSSQSSGSESSQSHESSSSSQSGNGGSASSGSGSSGSSNSSGSSGSSSSSGGWLFPLAAG